MRRSLLHVWLGTSVLTSTFLLGCNHCQRSGGACQPVAPVIGQGQTVVPNPATAVAADTADGKAEFAVLPAPAVQTTKAAEGPDLVPARMDQPPEPPIFGETAMVTFHAAQDDPYQTLTGKLEEGREPGTWVLHYTAVAEVDRYGGQLLLSLPNH